MTTYRIADLARELGVTTRTLRHYEEQGLVRPAREGSQRIFSGRDRVRLKLALRGKRLGFTLQEMKELFDLYDARSEREKLAAFMMKLEARRKLLEQQRSDIDAMMGEIEFFTVQSRRLMDGAPAPERKRRPAVAVGG
jgi:DNA-binding transcriptional MerR regulator